MTRKEMFSELLKNSTTGMISTKEIVAKGFSRDIIQNFVKSGDLIRFGRGLYSINDVWEDELYMLQQKYSRGIFSHDTALYLLGYSDRTPSSYTMTFPRGYNTPSLKDENVEIKRVIPDNYSLGVIEIKSPCDNPIKIYNLERTLCDILRGSGSDIQIVNSAMKQYAKSKDKNIHLLMQYAEQLKVKDKVLRYMEVLL